jgi:Malectin domain/Polysaccharide lyase
MFQRIFPLAIPTFFVLMCAVLLVPLASVHAQTTVNYNFEDGVVRGSPTKMKVPPKIVTENGKKFMRITGSKGDCQALPSNLCPPKNRSTVRFTSHHNSMPLITSDNMRQTYSADIRFHQNGGGSAFELFQSAPGGGAYAAYDGYGPVFRFWRQDGNVIAQSFYSNETKMDKVVFKVPSGQWHNYKVVAVWSHDPKVGRVEFYFDGQLKMRVTGKGVNLGPDSNRIPEMKMGLYGDYATGAIDVDNIKAGPSGSGGSTPPAPAPVPDAEVVAVNAGGAQYAGADGTVYRNDAWSSGGSTYTTTAAIAGTTDDRLYQTERFGDFSYNIPVANGDYLVTLKFAEIYWTEVGRRVFNVSMEGKAVLSHLDLVAKVGPKARYDVTLPVTVTGGFLTVGFQSVVDNATISGIKVAPKSASVSAATNVRVVSGQ